MRHLHEGPRGLVVTRPYTAVTIIRTEGGRRDPVP
jgi:hypothetical protein